MTDDRMLIWESLYNRAMRVLDASIAIGVPSDDWSFGGGTVLMLKYQHRFSKDVDIFVTDPQYITTFSPRTNDRAEDDTTGYDEQHKYVKLYYPEGEVDFVAATPVTSDPYAYQEILGRRVKVESPLEIVGKKIRFRAGEFKARDIYDLALVLDKEPGYVSEIELLLKSHRDVLQSRLTRYEESLREDFDAIDTMTYTPTFDYCLALLKRHAGF